MLFSVFFFFLKLKAVLTFIFETMLRHSNFFLLSVAPVDMQDGQENKMGPTLSLLYTVPAKSLENNIINMVVAP